MMMHLKQHQIFNPRDIDELLSDIKFIKNNKKLEYGNISISFDIETTSFYNSDGLEQATMYAWVFTFNEKIIIGRTWDEFILILKKIQDHYKLHSNKRLIIWIHNLAFEFAFMQNLFKWDSVFAVDKRKPVYAITNGIEFRCSYILSGYSLRQLAKNLVKHQIDKLVGDLDYSLKRHSKTPLSQNEYEYIVNDGLIVSYYISELLDQYGDFHKIPLTNTGFVRKYVRKETLYGGESSHKKTAYDYKKYHSLMMTLQIPSLQCYEQMKRVYSGGFTHGNALYNGVVIEDVTSYDFTSSYPSVMVCEKFPMTTPKRITVHNDEELKNYLHHYCCMFDVLITKLEPKLFQDHPLSESKCIKISNGKIDNGRVVKADKLITSMNETDFEYFKDFYKWEKIEFFNFRIMEKGYLPTSFVKAILKLYELKTTLKGKEDYDSMVRYQNAKGQLNSCYGMAVTDILQNNITFKNGVWQEEEQDVSKVFKKYNNSKSRFLYYAWGIWVTSYARRNLFMGVKAIGNDYLYADTDSMKIRNGNKYIPWINKYNDYIKYKMEKALKWHKLDFSMCSPKTIDGKIKPLGYWDFDGHYKKFKTLGAKRYLYLDDNNEMHLTCAGVSKNAINYMMKKSKNNIDKCFQFFKNDMFIPSSDTGKNIHTYIDFEMNGDMVDYLGNKGTYHELSGVHLTGAEYTLSLSKDYIDYLSGLNWSYAYED